MVPEVHDADPVQEGERLPDLVAVLVDLVERERQEADDRGLVEAGGGLRLAQLLRVRRALAEEVLRVRLTGVAHRGARVEQAVARPRRRCSCHGGEVPVGRRAVGAERWWRRRRRRRRGRRRTRLAPGVALALLALRVTLGHVSVRLLAASFRARPRVAAAARVLPPVSALNALGRVNCRFEIGRIRPTEICQIRRSESPDRESAETRAGSPPAVRVWRRLRNPLLDPWWLSAPSGGLRRLLEPTFAPPSRGVYRRVSSPRNPRVELLLCRSATRGHCTSPRRREGYT